MTVPRHDTATRILDEASHLFATQGFAATSTREIADAVGIQQPGLYKHFASKDAILLALFEDVYAYPMSVANALSTIDAPASARLYRFLDETARHVCRSPFAVASLLRTPEVRLPQFGQVRRATRKSDAFVADLVDAAVAQGDFRPVRRESAPRLLFGLIDALASFAHPSPTKADVDELLEFALHGLVRDRRRVEVIRRLAGTLDVGPRPALAVRPW